MHRFTLIFGFLLSLACLSAAAQDRKIIPDTVLINGDTLLMLGDSILIKEPIKEIFWKTGGNYNLNIQQVTLSNWAAGGTGSFALNSGATLFANYKKDSKVFFNSYLSEDFRYKKSPPAPPKSSTAVGPIKWN